MVILKKLLKYLCTDKVLMMRKDLMFCWPCIIVYQYNEINVMHFSFNLLRIKGRYMFQALLSHPQEALHKRHSVYCVCIMSVGCGSVLHPTHSQLTCSRTQYTKCRLCIPSWGWASSARNMLILNKLNEKCVTLASLCWRKDFSHTIPALCLYHVCSVVSKLERNNRNGS
jgi:hypothetical protein